MKTPNDLKYQFRDEAYAYFDKNIRRLPKTKDGKIDTVGEGLEDNDVDAFRHAYVSGVFTAEYGEIIADILGRLNEYVTRDIYYNSKNPKALNMDLWNNWIGRKYGKKAKSRRELLKMIHEALDNGELITDPNDKREYEGAKTDPRKDSKPVIVLKEDENGRNEIFFDLIKSETLSRSDFVAQIQAGNYPGYTTREVNGILTPVSKSDGSSANNLG